MAHLAGVPMANQTRIVLDEDDRPKQKQILEVTGIKTFSSIVQHLSHQLRRPLGKRFESDSQRSASTSSDASIGITITSAQAKQLPTIQPTQNRTA
jgi:hypothetical protein